MPDTPSDTAKPAFPVPAFAATHPAWLRLVDQLEWYDRKSTWHQHAYKRLKLLQLLLAILIPLASLIPDNWARYATAVAGAAIALLEGVQQMNQYARQWISYRATAERLKHEMFLFLSAAGPYRGLSEEPRLVQLAERVEEQISTEHSNWIKEIRHARRGGQDDPDGGDEPGPAMPREKVRSA
jgi:hypothetical protein